MPLAGIIGPGIGQTLWAGHPIPSRIRPTIAIRIRATPAVIGRGSRGGDTRIAAIGGNHPTFAEPLHIVAVAIAIGIVPLTRLVGEGVSKSLGVSDPITGRVRISIFVAIIASEAVVA